MPDSKPLSRLLNANLSVLLMMGLQDKFLTVAPNVDAFISQNLVMLKLAKLFSIPVFISEHNKGSFGQTIPAIKKHLPSDACLFDESTFGCLSIMDELKALERPQIMLCGFGAHIGVEQAAHQLLEQGFQVHIIQDATASRSSEMCQTALEKMIRAGAIKSFAEMAAFELLHDTASPHLKKMFKILFDWE